MSYLDVGLVVTEEPTKTYWANRSRVNQIDHESRIGALTSTLASQTTILNSDETRIAALETSSGNTILSFTYGSFAVVAGLVTGTIIAWYWPAAARYLFIHTGGGGRGNNHDGDSNLIINLSNNLLYGSYSFGSDSVSCDAQTYNGISVGVGTLVGYPGMYFQAFTPASRYLQIYYSCYNGHFAGSVMVVAFK